MKPDYEKGHKGYHKKSGAAAKLDRQKILNFFAVFTDLPDMELSNWYELCESAGNQISGRLREGVDVRRNMERLCISAAAVAYCNYSLMQCGISADEVRVGDISIKSAQGNNDAFDAIDTRDYFLNDIADLIAAPSEFPVCGAECRI